MLGLRSLEELVHAVDSHMVDIGNIPAVHILNNQAHLWVGMAAHICKAAGRCQFHLGM